MKDKVKPKGLRHIGIVTKKPDKLAEFYIEILGFKKSFDGDNINVKKITNLDKVFRVVKVISENGSEIEFLSPKFESNKVGISYLDCGITHIALTVAGMDEIYKKIKERGVKTYKDEVYVDDVGRKVFFCEDPDGNILELVEEP
jgi:catechol 2,3-dioxygenase-like lactoylglutathione lyase family enzyme